MTLHAPVHVLAAVIRRNDQALLICRRPAHKRHGDLWEFPGGKLESGETALDAARREMREELGLEVTSVGELLFSSADPDSPFIIDFYPVAVRGEPVPSEHSAIAWVSAKALHAYPLAPTDARFAATLATV